jgi:hypothetical protein
MTKRSIKNLEKWPKLPYFDPYISPNIGHGDLLFDIQIMAFHTINNYQGITKCAFNWQNMAPKSSKSAKMTPFPPYISLNIGQVDLLSCVQIDVPNTIHNHHTIRICTYKWQHVASKSWKMAKTAMFWPLYLPKYRSWWPTFWYRNKGIPYH